MRSLSARVAAGLALAMASTSVAFVPNSRLAVPVLPRYHNIPSRVGSCSPSLHLVSYDDLMEQLPSKKVIDAVENSRGNTVIASDVASAAGVSLSQARQDLTLLAAVTRGDIAVSKDGDLIYSFPGNLNSVISSNSLKFKVQNTFEKKVWPVLFYGIRVSFGVMLLVSIAAIFSTIAFISASGSNSDDNRRDNRRGGGMSFGYNFFGPSPFDFFYYRPYYGYRTPLPRRTGGYYEEEEDEMGFFESVFSYVLGDGNPNIDVEEKRLRLAARIIRANNGAVTAEQLAPVVDAPMPSRGADDPNDTSYVDESFVLPIVTQLGGTPEVTDDGYIVYVFDELQMSAVKPAATLGRIGLPEDATARQIKSELAAYGVDTRGALERDDLIRIAETAFDSVGGSGGDDTLVEEEYEFSRASDFNKVLAGGLGVVNLGGALLLGNYLGQAAAYGVQLPGYFGLVQGAYPLLLLYALLFNGIPLARNFWLKGKNQQIRERNKSRRAWKTLLQSSVGKVRRKLQAAKKFGSRVKQLGSSSKDILFDTKQTSEETEMKKETELLKDFDNLLDQNAWE